MWISIDPAWSGKTGYANWNGEKLISFGIIKPLGKSRWQIIDGQDRVDKFADQHQAWASLICRPDSVVVEVGRGSFRNADMPLGKRLGYINAVADSFDIGYNEIALSEWRRILREKTGYSWPTGSEAKKRLAQRIVIQAHDIDCQPDVADAICVGMAWIASGRAK